MSLLERVQLSDGFTAEDLNRLQTNIERALKRGRDYTVQQITNIVIGDVLADGDKGDITVSGVGTVWTIDNDVVTFAKMQNIATDRLIGRDTAGSGDPEELTVTGGLEFTGAGGIQRSALTGDITAAAGSNTTAFRAFLATSVLANATGAGAVPTELTAALNNQVLQRVAGVLAFAQLDYSQITGTPTLYYQTIENSAGAAQPQRTVWRASTGLTAADGGGVRTDVTVNLSTGIAGGQSAIGGTAASESLTLSSTAHATKGQILLGSGNYGFDETIGQLYLGAAGGLSTSPFVVTGSANATIHHILANTSTDAAGRTGLFVGHANTITGSYVEIFSYGSGFTPSGLQGPNVGELLHVGTANFLISQFSASGDVVINTTSARTERMRVASGGNVSIANLTAGGLVKATAGTGVLGIGSAGTDYEVPLTFSTGLTRIVNTVTANISTGLAGGQTAYGGTAASENLTLSSTTHATKANILFGAATSGFDELNTRLFVGTTPGNAESALHVSRSSNASIFGWFSNPNAGTSARTFVAAANGDTTTQSYITLITYGSGFTASGFLAPHAGELLHKDAAQTSHMLITQFANSADIIFTTTSSRTERMRIVSGGDITIGTGLATGATAGWLYLSSSAGPPTGASTSYSAGAVVPYHDDRTNKRLYRNTPGGSTWDIVGQYIGALASDAILKHSGGGVIGAATSANIAAAITWPTAGQVLVSSGTTTAPVGDTHFTYDTSTDLLSINAGGTQAWYNLDGATNYERVRAFWTGNTFTVKSEKGGTGTVRGIVIDGDAGYLNLTADTQTIIGTDIGSNPDIYFEADRVNVRLNKTRASASSVDFRGLDVDGILTLSGSTPLTSGGVTFTSFSQPEIVTAATVSTEATTVKIVGPPFISGGGTLGSVYSLWVDAGLARFDGDGTAVLEVPNDSTSNSTETVGRIPISITGVGVRYLRYYAD